jgi:GntR family transcriptional regulator, arabinose operon transcriptional repressor
MEIAFSKVELASRKSNYLPGAVQAFVQMARAFQFRSPRLIYQSGVSARLRDAPREPGIPAVCEVCYPPACARETQILAACANCEESERQRLQIDCRNRYRQVYCLMMDITDAHGKLPKYQKVRGELRRQIAEWVYQPGQKLPSDAELSARFQTSRLTVIRALQELQSEGLVERKVGSGTYVRRQPQQIPKVFGLLVANQEQGEIFQPICQSIAHAAQAAGHVLLWSDISCRAEEKERQTERLSRYYAGQRISGVFLSPVELTPHRHEVNRHVVEILERAGIPIILIDRCYLPYPERSRHDLVGIDNRRAGYRLARHLLDAGCARIAFLARPDSAPTVDARIAGVQDGIALAGRTDAMNGGVFIGDPSDCDAVAQFLRQARPDGIICANDRTAGALMHTLHALHIQIPRDMRMAGFDDVFADILPVPLTTLKQPCQQIAEAAIRAMLERIANPEMVTRDILLDCQLIVRQSCGSQAAATAA